MTDADGPKHSVSVSAVVTNDAGQILVIRRADNGHWEPPGGVLEREESITDGLLREVEEETGLVVKAEALTGVYKNVPRAIVALVFRCRVAEGHPRGTREALECRWLTVEEAVSRMTPAYATRVRDALEAGPPRVRPHDGEQLLPR